MDGALQHDPYISDQERLLQVWGPHPSPALMYPERDPFSDFPQDTLVEGLELDWPPTVPSDPYPYNFEAPGQEWPEDTLNWSHDHLTFADHSINNTYPLPEASLSAFEGSTPSTSSLDSSLDDGLFAGMNEFSVGDNAHTSTA